MRRLLFYYDYGIKEFARPTVPARPAGFTAFHISVSLPGMKKYFLLLPFLGFLATGCSNSKTITQQDPLSTRSPDYSNLNDWAAHPWKWDPSDSVPKPLRKNFIKDSVTDVFFIHPTTFTGKKNSNTNADIDDVVLNHKTDYSSVLFQASVFNESSRVFVPRYRQAHYRNYYEKNAVKAKDAFDLAYTDVKNSFEYYLTHYNNGRPVIIAAHSQGTQHAARLLKDFFEGKLLQNKLVCAYLIGMPTPENYFTEIRPCRDSLDTGCFLGWRTFKKGYEGTGYIIEEKFRSIVTNPLNWTTGTDYASAAMNKGAVLTKFNKINKGTSAQVQKNILWTGKPRFFGNLFLRKKNYHIGDINIFYLNIRENVKRRIGMYWKN
jgi:hypothetical protein